MDTEKQASAGQPTYLYAIAPTLKSEELGDIGLYGSRVHTIADGNVVAVVSELPSNEELRPERRLLAAHQAVVHRVTDESPVALPVSFGTIADNADGVRELLGRYAGEFREQMEKVKDKTQMNVRLFYGSEKPNVFEFLVDSKHPELKQERDRLFAGGRQPTRDEKIDFGQRLDAVLSEARDEYTNMFENALKSHCSAVRRNAPHNEREIVRLACLVPKGGQEEFERAVEEAAKPVPEAFKVEETGPFPPYDFTELHLRV